MNDSSAEKLESDKEEKPIKLSKFEETMKRNQEIKNKLAEERKKSNQNVLKSYRIK